MDAIFDFLKKPFAWGLFLGLLFFVLSAWAHLKTKRELRRYKKHLSDKLELEARQYEMIRKDKDAVARENENLRIKIQQLMEKPDQKVMRDLEVLTRAEKRMVMQAPGFAAAWESAKAQAADDLASEDAGKSLPRRLFNRLFGNSGVRDVDAKVLTENASSVQSPEPASTDGAGSNSHSGDPARAS